MIPSDVGGFFIREYGVFDASGNMLAIAKCAETYKPLPSDGSTKEINMKMVLAISNTSSITLKIDPTIIFAKKKDVDEVSSRVDAITTQLSDLTYQVAGGTATALTIQMQSLVNGYAKTFISGASNNGAATTINGKPIYKPNTATAPNLIAGKAYTVWYNSSKDCFFIKASAEGNTIATHVLAGDTFSNDSDTGLIGTMLNNGALNSNLNCGGTFKVPGGYTTGGTITANSLASQTQANADASKILSGYSAWVNGNLINGNASIQSLGEKKYAYIPGNISAFSHDSFINVNGTTMSCNYIDINIASYGITPEAIFTHDTSGCTSDYSEGIVAISTYAGGCYRFSASSNSNIVINSSRIRIPVYQSCDCAIYGY